MNSPVRNFIARIVLLLVALAISFGIAEVGLRLFLASDLDAAKDLRKPQHFADFSWEDTYWLLQDSWQQKYRRPKNPHPLLGWAASIDHETYLHDDAKSLQGRQPVLLYGDSFSQTVWQAKSFEDLFNQDPADSESHYLLNYGTGGYGLDQILLSMEKSLHHYEEPFVVFGFMTYDMYRSPLSVRVGQKPYFSLQDGELELRGVPIDMDSDHYFETHPPEVRSYLWRLLLYYQREPGAFRSWLRGEDEKMEYKQALNRKILERAKGVLDGSGVDYVFLVFHPKGAFLREPEPHDLWLRETLDEIGVPYIWSLDTVRNAVPDATPNELFIPGNAHPTTLFNEVIAEAISERVRGDTQAVAD